MKLTSEFVAAMVFQNVHDLLLLIDSSGNIIEVNRIVKNVLGYKDSELISKPLKSILPDDTSPVYDIIRNSEAKIVMDNTSQDIFDSLFLSKSGHAIPISCSCITLRHESNNEFAFVIIGEDKRLTTKLHDEICRRKKVEIELRDTNQRLQDLDKLKSDFLSSISHELRTPLTSVLGFSVLSKKKLENNVFPAINSEDKKLNRDLTTINDNFDIVISESKKLAGIINDLLDIAQMQAGNIDWKMVLVSVTEIIDTALSKAKPLFEEKGLHLVMEVSEELPKVTGNKDRLTQVVTNLLANAEKFTPEGSVTIKAEKDQNNIVVSVSDTGIGISKDDFNKIFNEFGQLGDPLTSKPPGLGLGLTICRQIVELHGGSVWVESEIGKGSTFFFSLPLFDSSFQSLEQCTT